MEFSRHLVKRDDARGWKLLIFEAMKVLQGSRWKSSCGVAELLASRDSVYWQGAGGGKSNIFLKPTCGSSSLVT
eukprot:6050385-Prorocentrum_lima.AAC.1